MWCSCVTSDQMAVKGWWVRKSCEKPCWRLPPFAWELHLLRSGAACLPFMEQPALAAVIPVCGSQDPMLIEKNICLVPGSLNTSYIVGT